MELLKVALDVFDTFGLNNACSGFLNNSECFCAFGWSGSVNDCSV